MTAILGSRHKANFHQLAALPAMTWNSAMFELTVKLSLSYKQVRALLTLLMLLIS